MVGYEMTMLAERVGRALDPGDPGGNGGAHAMTPDDVAGDAASPDRGGSSRSTPSPGAARGAPRRELPMESLVIATGQRTWPVCRPEYRAILEMAGRPVSLVEIGAALGIPVGVARVLVERPRRRGLRRRARARTAGDDGRPAPPYLERLLEGLRAR